MNISGAAMNLRNQSWMRHRGILEEGSQHCLSCGLLDESNHYSLQGSFPQFHY
jgi:hypothetical protein